MWNNQIHKLKSISKNAENITLRLSSNVTGNTTDETNFYTWIITTWKTGFKTS